MAEFSVLGSLAGDDISPSAVDDDGITPSATMAMTSPLPREAAVP